MNQTDKQDELLQSAKNLLDTARKGRDLEWAQSLGLSRIGSIPDPEEGAKQIEEQSSPRLIEVVAREKRDQEWTSVLGFPPGTSPEEAAQQIEDVHRCAAVRIEDAERAKERAEITLRSWRDFFSAEPRESPEAVYERLRQQFIQQDSEGAKAQEWFHHGLSLAIANPEYAAEALKKYREGSGEQAVSDD